MEDFEGQFAALSIAKRSEQNKDPTYLLDIDCSKTAAGAGNQQLVAVSCSNKSIHVYNKQTLGLVGQYSGHSGPICGVRFAQTSDNLLFTASGDGTVRCWDVRTPGTDAVQVFRGYPSNVFSSFDVNCSDLVICAGTEKVHEDTFMVFWDARVVNSNGTAGAQPLGVYSESHNDDITQVRFHPSKPDMVVSGSTDGLVNVFDIGTDTEDDALLATCNSDSSVSSITWSGERYDQICCLTHDEGLFWWDLAQLETEEPITLLSVQDARETTEIQGGHLDYLISGMYHERAKKLVVVGGTNTGKLHLLDCRAEGLRHMCALQDSHSATVRCFHWHTGDDSLLTAGEDAQLLLWKPGAEEHSTGKKGLMKSVSSVQQKTRVHSKNMWKRKK
ncbi:WDR89 protein, partial [Polyodon spathula]|nr:WD repeat-containing protein 89-like [Polyodon spathula]XP_041131078.1 WD repeat-containing protein 89-like [Polyodon spathula]MBN3287711.1 WDR89 protein [Polyodon spathula]